MKVGSVYAPLVPSARVESPLLDQYGGYTAKTMVASSNSNRSVSIQLVHITGNQSRGFFQTGALPGSVALTLDAMPDPDSAIVYSYNAQNDSEVTIRTGTAATDKISFRHITEKPGIKPGSLTISYLSNDLNRTLTDQNNGTMTGDGSGSIHYAPGELSFVLDNLPDAGTEIEIQYEEGTVSGGQISVSVDGSGLMSGTINGAPLLPGSVHIEFTVERDSNVPTSAYRSAGLETYQTTYQKTKSYSDDGSGNWRGIAGTIDYATGAFTLQATENYNYPEYQMIREKS